MSEDCGGVETEVQRLNKLLAGESAGRRAAEARLHSVQQEAARELASRAADDRVQQLSSSSTAVTSQQVQTAQEHNAGHMQDELTELRSRLHMAEMAVAEANARDAAIAGTTAKHTAAKGVAASADDADSGDATAAAHSNSMAELQSEVADLSAKLTREQAQRAALETQRHQQELAVAAELARLQQQVAAEAEVAANRAAAATEESAALAADRDKLVAEKEVLSVDTQRLAAEVALAQERQVHLELQLQQRTQEQSDDAGTAVAVLVRRVTTHAATPSA